MRVPFPRGGRRLAVRRAHLGVLRRRSSAKEFFERPEKTWRPMAALLFSQALAAAGDGAVRPAL
jgi:hypothetical protein